MSQDNFLGSGNRVSFAFNNSNVTTIYNFYYTNPYYTINGVSRGFGLYYKKTNADQANISSYSTDTYGANVNYGIPINEFDTVRVSPEFQNLKLKEANDSPNQVIDFIQQHGNDYNTVTLNSSWSHDTRNKVLLTDEGGLQSLSLAVAVPGSDLEYYKLNYEQRRYVPLTRNLTLSMHAQLGYGNGYGSYNNLPFFENYFAGGVRSVRGFEDNTLGPTDSNGNPIGGSVQVVGGTEVLFPAPFMEDSKSFRLGTFLDIGNVYSDLSSFDAGELRYSVGVSALWISPMGPLSISLGFPLNASGSDKVQNFQFTVGF